MYFQKMIDLVADFGNSETSRDLTLSHHLNSLFVFNLAFSSCFQLVGNFYRVELSIVATHRAGGGPGAGIVIQGLLSYY